VFHFLLVPVAAMSITVADKIITYQNGNELFDECSSKQPNHQLSCFGYLEGIADEMSIATAAIHAPQCIPSKVQATQLRDIAVNYLRAHPEIRQEPAAYLVTDAYVAAWNCARPEIDR
jgi:hypothetical protein